MVSFCRAVTTAWARSCESALRTAAVSYSAVCPSITAVQSGWAVRASAASLRIGPASACRSARPGEKSSAAGTTICSPQEVVLRTVSGRARSSAGRLPDAGVVVPPVRESKLTLAPALVSTAFQMPWTAVVSDCGTLAVVLPMPDQRTLAPLSVDASDPEPARSPAIWTGSSSNPVFARSSSPALASPSETTRIAVGFSRLAAVIAVRMSLPGEDGRAAASCIHSAVQSSAILRAFTAFCAFFPGYGSNATARLIRPGFPAPSTGTIARRSPRFWASASASRTPGGTGPCMPDAVLSTTSAVVPAVPSKGISAILAQSPGLAPWSAAGAAPVVQLDDAIAATTVRTPTGKLLIFTVIFPMHQVAGVDCAGR